MVGCFSRRWKNTWAASWMGLGLHRRMESAGATGTSRGRRGIRSTDRDHVTRHLEGGADAGTEGARRVRKTHDEAGGVRS